ncbi:MAG: DUF401 family protein [bacterium]|nr:DUF401 family protein [bacterium]
MDETNAVIRQAVARRLNLLFNVGLIVLVAMAARATTDPLMILREKFFVRGNFELLVLFAGVLLIGSLYRQMGALADHLVYWTRFLKHPRSSIVATALVLGAMPVKGRTIMVSPVVAEVAKQHRLAVFPTAMVNHLATHTSYLISPLSASLLLATSTLGLDFFKFVGYLLPGTLVLVAVVVYYAWRVNVAKPTEARRRDIGFLPAALLSAPLVILIVALALAELNHLPYAVAGGTVLFVALSFLALQPKRGQVVNTVRAMDISLLLTLALILLLSSFTGSLPAIKTFASAAVASNFTLPVLVIVGYLTGLIIGSSTTMVAAVFPVMAPLLAGSEHIYPLAAATYAAQYAGYIASPSHPCCHYVAAYFRKPYLQLWVRISGVAIAAAAAVIVVAWWRG